MSSLPELERIRHITLTPGMKLIVMSDMHRGDGSSADDFAKNSLIYRCALTHYLENGFTYIELGDAEELQAGYKRFTKDYYRMIEIVYRAFKQPNAVATITRLIANMGHRMNCMP
jgi:hypothetical protein